ncbi:MAG: Maf family protein [Enterobacterales bacterium]|nr:Maf family protein [Enterobacterales bacterium]
MNLYLASKSQRRQMLLTQIGIPFECLEIDIDESKRSNETLLQYVKRMAQEKAFAGLAIAQHRDQPVLAADTCVSYKELLLDKPTDAKDAKRILCLLAGKTHQVMTSVVIMDQYGFESAISVTDVSFAPVSEALIDYYIDTGECFGKAGSYAIQGYAARFVTGIKGSYTGVVGLPLFETAELIEKFAKTRKY